MEERFLASFLLLALAGSSFPNLKTSYNLICQKINPFRDSTLQKVLEVFDSTSGILHKLLLHWDWGLVCPNPFKTAEGLGFAVSVIQKRGGLGIRREGLRGFSFTSFFRNCQPLSWLNGTFLWREGATQQLYLDSLFLAFLLIDRQASKEVSTQRLYF